ncbi:MAG: VOC family protein [Proteobacteria bacterium]|nr:VOC family protein [Pseudomonadota bacterium]
MNLESDHIALNVADQLRSRKFYELIGGKIVSKASPYFMEIVIGNQRLHIVTRGCATKNEKNTAPADVTVNPVIVVAPPIDHFCLRVSNLVELEALLNKLNGSPLLADQRQRSGPLKIIDSPPLGAGAEGQAEEFPPLKTLYLRDPDGVGIEIRAYQ